ncbi:MAG: hypothetical protein R3C55_08490 [Parvularculaceae bacterium]
MHHFEYRGGVLHAEDVSLEKIAADVGTPFYCYSEATIRRHIRVFQAAFKGCDTLIAYFLGEGEPEHFGHKSARKRRRRADVVSGGELKRARAAGIPASKIVFSGVGKTREEMALAISEGIHQFNVESEPELDALSDVAISKGAKAPIAFRVNPDVSRRA